MTCLLEVHLSKLIASMVPSAPARNHLAVLNMLSEPIAGLIVGLLVWMPYEGKPAI